MAPTSRPQRDSWRWSTISAPQALWADLRAKRINNFTPPPCAGTLVSEDATERLGRGLQGYARSTGAAFAGHLAAVGRYS